MLLAIDIGNTNISFGLFQGRRIISRFSLATKNYRLQNIDKNLGKADIDDVIVCSVVPDVGKIIEEDSHRLSGKKPWVIGKDIIVPVRNHYRNPKQVGADRLVNAYAGIMLYGAPLIIVDFGTAITFDVVSKNREYLGGVILPGLKISLEALREKTALLPKVKLERPKELIGRDTRASMLSGIVYGSAGSIHYLIKIIGQRLGERVKVIGTGGDINLISSYSEGLNKINRDLTLQGLNLLYAMAIAKKNL